MIKDINNKTCVEILGKNYVGRLAFIAEGEPCVIPITYYYDRETNSIISYSTEGHKIESMRISNSVALQVDEVSSVNRWQSVLVHGLYEELHQIDAKFNLHEFTEGVKKVIAERDKENPHFIGEFSAKLRDEGSPVVYRINIKKITGKQRQG